MIQLTKNKLHNPMTPPHLVLVCCCWLWFWFSLLWLLCSGLCLYNMSSCSHASIKALGRNNNHTWIQQKVNKKNPTELRSETETDLWYSEILPISPSCYCRLSFAIICLFLILLSLIIFIFYLQIDGPLCPVVYDTKRKGVIFKSLRASSTSLTKTRSGFWSLPLAARGTVNLGNTNPVYTKALCYLRFNATTTD